MSESDELLKAIRERELKSERYVRDHTKKRLDTYTNISDERKNALKDLVSLYDVFGINKAPEELSEDEDWYFYLWRQYCRCNAVIGDDDKEEKCEKESFMDELRRFHHEKTLDGIRQWCKGDERIRNENDRNRYLIIGDDGFAVHRNDIADAKIEASDRLGSGCDVVYIYEKKIVSSVTKPKIEFNEV